MEKAKWLLSAILGLFATFFDHYGILIALVLISICFDVVTGLVKAKINEEVSSVKGTKGFFKKISLLICMFFGFFLDVAIPYMFSRLGITLGFNLPTGMIVSIYICLNESISVCENLYACDSAIMPKWIVKILLSAKDKVENAANEDIKEE